jgi:peptidoglycan/LPS O-acetylase OafA/YrhL
VIFPVLKTYFGQTPHETSDPVLCSVFLNNFDRIQNGPPDSSVLSVLWSVAIEEQFYLVWPVLFFLVPTKYYHYLFLGVIAVSVTYRATHLHSQIEIHSLGVISDMAIGGLGAYLSIKSARFLKMMENGNPLLSLLPYVAAICFLVFKYELFTVPMLIACKRLIIAFFFIWIILDQNLGKRSYFKVSQMKTISKLGKYTYGLYCLHTIAVLVVLVTLDKLGLNKTTLQLWLLEFPLTLGLSILMSYVSYIFFESRFLRLKDRFAYIVKS